MKHNKNNQVHSQKQRSLPKILPRILHKPQSARLIFPKKDDSSLYEGVGKKHYGFTNGTSLQKLMSPEVQQKIEDYRRKIQQKHQGPINFNKIRQKSENNIPEEKEQLYFSSGGKKKRMETQLHPQMANDYLKTEESKPIVQKLGVERKANLKALKTDIEIEKNEGKLGEEKRYSLLKNSHLRVIGGPEAIFDAMGNEKREKVSQNKVEEIKKEKELMWHRGQSVRIMNPTFNSLGMLY